MRVHHKFRVPIRLPTVAPIEVDALITPTTTTKLVSVKQVVDATGPVTFTKQGAYSLFRQLFDIFDLRQNISICHNVV